MPVYFTVFDSVKPQDSTTYPNYKYVADVYINATLVARLKAYPDPVTFAGVFDISPIVRSYFESNFAPDQSLTGNQFAPYMTAQVKFGEDYGGTTYTNLITDSSRNYYDTYKAGPYTNPVITWLNNFATDRPGTIEAIEDGLYQLVPYQPAASGTLNYTINGVAGSVMVTNPSGLIHFNLSSANVSGATSATLVVSGITKVVTFKCAGKYPTRTLAFLNKYGGYETYDFSLVSKASITMERKAFERTPIRLGVSGVLSYESGDVYHTGKQTYATRAKQSLRVTSDYLNDAMYRWLGELVQSPEVYYFDGSYWVPCQLIANAYEYKTLAVDRLTLLELDISLTGDYNTQFR